MRFLGAADSGIRQALEALDAAKVALMAHERAQAKQAWSVFRCKGSAGLGQRGIPLGKAQCWGDRSCVDGREVR